MFNLLFSPSECDVSVPGIFHFFGGIGTGIGTNWYRKKVSEPVSEKFGTGKRSRNRYRKNLVPEQIFVAIFFEFGKFIMGTGTGTGNFSFFLVVSAPVSEKFGTGKSLGTETFISQEHEGAPIYWSRAPIYWSP